MAREHGVWRECEWEVNESAGEEGGWECLPRRDPSICFHSSPWLYVNGVKEGKEREKERERERVMDEQEEQKGEGEVIRKGGKGE